MADQPALALILAGSGETNADEVYDLLEDAYPVSEYDEVGLVFATDKDLFTPAVEHVIAWHDNEKSLYPVHTKGAAMSRKTSKFESSEVSKFADVFDPDDWAEWDEVVFLIAMPEDEDDPDYDLYAGLVETAIDKGFKVKNLSRGLDDVTLEDPDEPEPDPEPEPEETPKRSRRKKAEPKEEPEVPEDPPGDSAEEQAEVARAAVALQDERQEVLADLDNVQSLTVYEALGDVIDGLLRLRDLYAPTLSPGDAKKVEKALEEPEEEAEKPEKQSRGRGRPRTRFEVKQVWDEDEEEWVARPAGRLRKGTQWRTIHSETDEVLEEGTA